MTRDWQANAVMKRRLPALNVVHRQLQKTEAPDRLTGIASLTEDQSDASTWRLPGNYSQGLSINQSINQSERIKVTKVTNVTARPLYVYACIYLTVG